LVALDQEQQILQRHFRQIKIDLLCLMLVTDQKVFKDFKKMKFGNTLINIDIEDIILEEIEQTLFIVERAKDINQFLEA
jgi:hypothetical protein